MTNGTITTCGCSYCQEYESVTCDACGTEIIPAHDAVRVHDVVNGADLCRGCVGAGFADQIGTLSDQIAARDAAEMDARHAYLAAHDAAEAAFWAAATAALPAYDAAIAAARQRHKDATGKDATPYGGPRRPDRGLLF